MMNHNDSVPKMANFTVTYDQHRDRDYTPIWNALKKLGAVRLLESFWGLTVNTTAAQLRDHLKQVTKMEDSIVVVEAPANSDWACTGVQNAGVTWLQQNVRR
jgi:hypothetical protein